MIAWNLLTGLYFKVDGLPWGPTGLPGSCHIGISFFRPLGETSALRTSVVQAFDENGEGLVLRGHKLPLGRGAGRSLAPPARGAGRATRRPWSWTATGGRARTARRAGRDPQDLPLRARGAGGLRAGPPGLSRYDLVRLSPTSEVRLLRAGQYPPLRGTVFSIGDVSYCYTTGYLPSLGRYPHGHVPSPLQVADHVGDTPRQTCFGRSWC